MGLSLIVHYLKLDIHYDDIDPLRSSIIGEVALLMLTADSSINRLLAFYP